MMGLTENEHTFQGMKTTFSYRAVTDFAPIKDDKGKKLASMFFTAYLGEGENRPILFCFNGGPGAASVWLHFGALGPKRISLHEHQPQSPPYTIIDNPHSLLPYTDLIFIDPISTGYSFVEDEVDVKQFHDIEKDIDSIGICLRCGKRNNSVAFIKV